MTIGPDEVWVLADPALTFVRIEPARSVPLGAGSDDDAPIVAGTRLLLSYRTPAGGAVYVEQGELVDPDATSVPGAPSGGDARPSTIVAGAPGEAPTLTTVAGGRRIVISAAAGRLQPLASTLEAIDRASLDAMVREVTAVGIADGEAQPLSDGVTLHVPPTGDPVACVDGQEPAGCAIADHHGPMVMAPIPQDGSYVVAGCILVQPVPVTEVTVDGRTRPVRAAPCGVAFAVPDISPGTLTITFDDGPGGVGTYTFDLP